MKRCRILVSGRVQGVFFRAFTRENAMQLGLTGWVRNTSDERVEAVVEGEEKSINELIKRLKKGPPASSVTKFEVEWQEPKGNFNNFSIIR